MIKYNSKYAKQLLEGICRDGTTYEEVCQAWGISIETYKAWEEKYPKFAQASKMAELDRICYWRKLARHVSEGKVRGNASAMNFALKNIKGINWQDKVEINTNGEDYIESVNINILPTSSSDY